MMLLTLLLQKYTVNVALYVRQVLKSTTTIDFLNDNCKHLPGAGAATSSERFCKMFSESSPGCWTVLQLHCCPSKQGELSENLLQNLQNKCPSHLVQLTWTEKVSKGQMENYMLLPKILMYAFIPVCLMAEVVEARSLCKNSTTHH